MKKIKLEKNDIFATAVCLGAIIPGLLVWNELPDKIARHFDINGNPDGYSSKLVVVVMFPLLMACISLFVSFMLNSGRAKDNPEKVRNLVRFIIPALLYVTQAGILLYALDKLKDFTAIELAFFSVFIILIGNYMPKIKPNWVVGLRTAHTMENKECWRVSHRFGGKVWVVGGIICLAFGLMGKLIPFFIVVAAIIIIPIVYSEIAYKKIKAEEAGRGKTVGEDSDIEE